MANHTRSQIIHSLPFKALSEGSLDFRFLIQQLIEDVFILGLCPLTTINVELNPSRVFRDYII